MSKYDRAIIERLLNKWAHADMDAVFYGAKLQELLACMNKERE